MKYDLVKIAKERMQERQARMEKKLECSDMPDAPQLPWLHLRAEQLGEMKDWKVGNEYEVKVTLRMSSITENKTLEGEDSCSAAFEICAIETP